MLPAWQEARFLECFTEFDQSLYSQMSTSEKNIRYIREARGQGRYCLKHYTLGTAYQTSQALTFRLT